MAHVAGEIRRAVDRDERSKELAKDAWTEELVALDRDITHMDKARALSESAEGVRRVTEAAHSIITAAKARVEQDMPELESLSFTLAPAHEEFLPDRLKINARFHLPMQFEFECTYNNSLEDCLLYVTIFYRDSRRRRNRGREIVDRWELTPRFDRDFAVYWVYQDGVVGAGKAVVDKAFKRFVEAIRRETDTPEW